MVQKGFFDPQPEGADLLIQQAVGEYEAFYLANKKKEELLNESASNVDVMVDSLCAEYGDPIDKAAVLEALAPDAATSCKQTKSE